MTDKKKNSKELDDSSLKDASGGRLRKMGRRGEVKSLKPLS